MSAYALHYFHYDAGIFGGLLVKCGQVILYRNVFSFVGFAHESIVANEVTTVLWLARTSR